MIGAGETTRTTNYELLGNDWATRAPVLQTLQSVRQTCSRTTTTCACMFAGFPSSGKFKPTRTNPTETTTSNTNVIGAAETSRTTNYELLGKDWATRAPVAQTLQSVRQTCSRTTATCACMFAGFPSSGDFKPTRTNPGEQQQQAAVETRSTESRGLDKTRFT